MYKKKKIWPTTNKSQKTKDQKLKKKFAALRKFDHMSLSLFIYFFNLFIYFILFIYLFIYFINHWHQLA